MKKLVALLLALVMVFSISVATFADGAAKEDLVVAIPNDLDGFDPTMSTMLMNVALLPLLYDGLYEKDENASPVPALAKTTEQISDTEWVFTIYEGVMFSDGTELTSEDVVASLTRAKGASIAASVMAPVETIEAVDKYTVKITTTSKAPTLTTSLSHVACLILPKKFLEQAEATGDWSNPVGSGRYIFDSWNIGDSFKFVANENYFRPEEAAQNKSITFKVVPEGSSRTIMVETGEADAALSFQTSDYNRVKDESNVMLYEAPSATMYYMAMDTQNEYFSNKLVRQAVNYAVDREACILAGFNGLGTPLYTYLAPPCLSYEENPAGYTYDVEKAKALLAEAGYPNGFDTVMYVSNETGTLVAECVQAYLMQIGINAEIKLVDSSSNFINLATAGELPLSVSTWACWMDPDMFIARIYGNAGMGGYNFARYENEEFEKLYQLGKSTFDEAERISYYKQIQSLLSEDAIWCPILCPTAFALANSSLQGVTCGTGGFWYFDRLHY